MSTSTHHRRNAALKVATCCALCVSLLLHLPTREVDGGSRLKVETTLLRGKGINGNVTASRPNVTLLNSTDRDAVNKTMAQQHQSPNLDFFIAGFAKCGTTALLKTFDQHNETEVAPKEECSLDLMEDDNVAYNNVIDALSNSSSSSKHGIKCPFTFANDELSLARIQKWFPSTKLIYGLRHPVEWFESFYNYRVLGFYAGKVKGPIPPAESLIGDNEWQRVSINAARFETTLQKLIVPSPNNSSSSTLAFPIFMYTMEQMKNETENESLRKSLQSYLGLKHEIQPLPVVNVNKHVGNDGYAETIDICSAKYDELRAILIQNGKKTQEWIRVNLLPLVTVANRESFTSMLKEWGIDPCNNKREQEAEET